MSHVAPLICIDMTFTGSATSFLTSFYSICCARAHQCSAWTWGNTPHSLGSVRAQSCPLRNSTSASLLQPSSRQCCVYVTRINIYTCPPHKLWFTPLSSAVKLNWLFEIVRQRYVTQRIAYVPSIPFPHSDRASAGNASQNGYMFKPH